MDSSSGRLSGVVSIRSSPETRTIAVFESLCTELKTLHARRRERQRVGRGDVVPRFDRAVRALRTLADRVRPDRIAQVRSRLVEIRSSLELSVFELMEYDFHENTHSNVLAHLADSVVMGSVGPSILNGLLRAAGVEGADDLALLIGKGRYRIVREAAANAGGRRGRIDLLVRDDENRIVIVIENKVHSGVHPVDEKRTQLDLYREYANVRFRGYRCIFILLSFRDDGREYPGYIRLSYEDVARVLAGQDHPSVVLAEYRRLLASLLSGIRKKDAWELIRAIEDSCELGLNHLTLLSEVPHHHET